MENKSAVFWTMYNERMLDRKGRQSHVDINSLAVFSFAWKSEVQAVDTWNLDKRTDEVLYCLVTRY